MKNFRWIFSDAILILYFYYKFDTNFCFEQ